MTAAATDGGYRRDVQGLRAIAVLVVVADHAALGPLTGGFVGVDVFFVVSGFLITQLLLAEVARTGRISLGGFYARRARRILPAASLVLAVTAVASSLLVGPLRGPAVLEDTVWAAAFLANVRFAHQGTDYFARDLPPSPVQHYWSLAVEEQFYLVWPALLIGLVALARLVAARRRRDAEAHRMPWALLTAALLLVAGASLLWSVARTDAVPAAAYFSSLTRAWELAVGALAAVAVRWSSRTRSAPGEAAGWRADLVAGVGLVAVAAACLGYDARTPFPGSAALLPVLGTASILVVGAGGAERRTLTGRLLGLRPLRAVGDWSYSIYLWHWPALVLAAAWTGGPLTTSARLGLVLATIALSALTHRLVEDPLRRARTLRLPRRGLVLYPLSLTLVAASVLGANGYLGWAESRGDDPAVSLGAQWEKRYDTADPAVALVRASVLAAREGQAVPSRLEPRLTEVSDSVGDLGACDYSDDDERDLCPRGDRDAERTIVVLGNSHARHWVDAFDRIGTDTGYRVYHLAKVKCLASLVTPVDGQGRPFEGCTDFHSWALEQVADLEPDLVVVSSSGTRKQVRDAAGDLVTGDAARPAVEAGYVDLFRRLRDAVDPVDGRVVLLEDVPAVAPEPSACLAGRRATLRSCLAEPLRLSAALAHDQVEAAEQVRGTEVVPTRQWFCWDGSCPAVVGDLLPYRDGEHMTNEYAASLAGPLARRLHLSGAP